MSIHMDQTRQKSSETLNSHPPQNTPLRKVRNDSIPYAGIPKNELTPSVETAMTQLIREVDRLKSELSEAKERVVLLENIAEEDPLIPILNRRGFERELDRAIANTARYKTQSSILYVDVDHFKSINDSHGHKAGDIALRYIASYLIENIRQSDVIARIGGDEFALILQYINPQTAKSKAKQLEENLKKAPCKFENATIPLEITIGISNIRSDDDITSLMDRADKEMYAIRAERRITSK